MKPLRFDFGNCFLSKHEQTGVFQKLLPFIKKVNTAQDKYAFLRTCSDTKSVQETQFIAQKIGNIDCLVIVGIGGSNLGTLAIIEALYGKLYSLRCKPLILFSDTVDEDTVFDMLQIVEKQLKAGKRVVINGISKSGTTTETIANFELFVSLLQKYNKAYAKKIVVTTDKDSPFWTFAKERGFFTLEIPHDLGGRYSVFSSVGLFPFFLTAIDGKKLLQGGLAMQERCLSLSLTKNPAAQSAIIQYLHYKKYKKNSAELFLFSTDFESIGKWYRQLLAESIGKEKKTKTRSVSEGITPTVSIGSTDLHSVGQLDLAGPKDKLTTFVFVEQNRHFIVEKKEVAYNALVPSLQGRALSEIMRAIYDGTKKAFIKKQHPFIEIFLPNKSEKSLGQFLQYKMIEILYLGFLLGVNVFDQPEVELYKKETRRILARD